MLPFLLSTLLGGLVDIPTMILVSLAGCFTLCGCVYCSRMRLRNCCCCKCFLRAVRYDNFDDFELRVMLHEASGGTGKKSYMKISAGNHVVKSERSGTGKFFEKLDIFVEQGTSSIKFDLMDTAGNCLATLKLDPSKDVLEGSYLGMEHTFNMKPNHKGVVYPKLTLTMFVNTEIDVETPLIEDGSADMNILLLQHISKTANLRAPNAGDAAVSEIETLREAGSGRAELFRGIGKTESVYLAIVGPPRSRRWTLGLWSDFKSFQSRKASIVEVNLLKIGSIRADSIRSRVFVVNYFDECKVVKKLTLRAVDTSRDVWVEMLTHLVNIAHDQREEVKEMRGKRSPRH